jgi:predicted permease
MKALRAFLVRLAGVFDAGRRDREMAEELASHLEMEVDENVRRGMAPEQARRAAHLASGGIESARETCRDRRGLPIVEDAVRDLRHAVRLLARSPAFTLVAVASLALGVGANTAVFTLLDQLVLRPLPVREPGQLQMIWTTGPHLGGNQGSRSSSYPMYQDFQQQAQAFSHVFCRYVTPVSVTLGDRTERVMGELVSGNYFQALGVGPALGRVLTPEQDDRVHKGHPVVVLGHEYWVARLGADPGIVGRTILVNNYPMTVVGVSAAGFSGLDPAGSPQLRIPIQMKPVLTPGSDNLGDRRRQWVQIFARRKPGYTMDEAKASLQAVLATTLRGEAGSSALGKVRRDLLDRFLARKVVTESAATGYSELRRGYATGLVALMAMVGLVLLIACFNLAGLLVARASARQKELGVRLALGASRGRLVRQLLIESAVLSAAGSALGVLLSVATVRVLLGFLPGTGMIATLQPVPDARVLAFTAILSAATVVLFGLAPARRAVDVDLSGTLKEASATIGGGRGSARLRRGLVTAQVALSLVLVAGALLFARTMGNLRDAGSGFHEIDRLVTFQVDPARSGYSLGRVKAFYRQLLENVQSVPGVTSAAYAWVQVLSGREADWDVRVEGWPEGDRDLRAYVNGLSPGYWRTMGVPLLAGRDFDEGDVDGRPRVAIVSRAFATRFFGERSPVGRHISLNMDPRAPLDTEIVGVVEDSLYEGPRQGVRRQVFFPFPQMNQIVGVAFYARGAADPRRVLASLRVKAQELDPTIPVYEMKTLERQLDETLGNERLTATLSAAFGGLATALAAIGLYGVVSLTVARRTREIGLRKALGAGRGTVVWMVLKEALALLGVGLGVGLPAAWLLGRLLASQLFGVVPADAGTAVAACLVLAVVTMAAALLPARRASMIDPLRALRHDS